MADDDDNNNNGEEVEKASTSTMDVKVEEEQDDNDNDNDEPMHSDAQATTIKTEVKTEAGATDDDADEKLDGDDDGKDKNEGNNDDDDDDDDDDNEDGKWKVDEDNDNDNDNGSDDDNDDNDSQGDGSSSEDGDDDDSSDEDDDDDDEKSENDVDGDDNDNGEENQDQNNDGLSEYERLRLARIKRNQERLASLGLAQGTGVFGGHTQKKKKKKKKIDLDDSAGQPMVRSRNSISRSSKKRIDYAEQPKLHEVKETSTSKNRKKKDNHDDNRRKHERGRNERVPLFVYQEFLRLKSKRRIGFTTAKKHKRKSIRELKYWTKAVNKIVIEETKQKEINDRDIKLRQRHEVYQTQIAAEKLEYCGYTKLEILNNIQSRKSQLYEIMNQQESLRTQSNMLLRQQQMKQIELSKRIILERKMSMIDIIDKYPKYINDTLNQLNTLFYSRIPPIIVSASASRVSSRRKTYDSSSSSSITTAKKSTTTTTTTTVMLKKKSKKKSLSSSSSSLLEQKQQQQQQQQRSSLQQLEPPPKKKQKRTSTSTSKPSPVAAITKKKTSKKRGRSMPPLPLNDAPAPTTDTIAGVGVGAGAGADVGALVGIVAGSPVTVTVTFAAAATTTTTTTIVDPSLSSSSQQKKKGARPHPPTMKTKTARNNNKSSKKNQQQQQQQQSKGSPKSISSSSNSPERKSSKVARATADSESNIISGKSKNDGNNDININIIKKKRKQPVDSSTVPPSPSPQIPTPRKSKTKDGRYVGGWMSPHFSQELDRSWLERTKPLTKTIVVPEDVAKRCVGLSSVKKTAVFDLKNYVPQVGDIILYYPSSHKDFLNLYPDTLGSRQRQLIRVPIWNRANRERNRLSKEEQENGKIWWTDEWIESLSTVRKSKKEIALEEAAKASTTGFKEGKDSNNTSMPLPPPPPTTSLGDYPIICRVERTHNEFPEDPYAKEKSIKTKDDSTGIGDMAIMSWSKTAARTLSPAVAEAKKKNGMCPQIRLAVTLRPLSPVVAPDDINVSSSFSSSSQSPSTSYRLELAPNFTISTCPGKCESFLVPFCWGYTTFHTLSIGESIWIQRSVNDDHNEDDSDTKKAGRIASMCGKGKIIDFFFGEKEKSKTRATAGMKKEEEEEKVPSLSPPPPPRPTPTRGIKHSIRLEDSIDDIEKILASLSKEGLPVPQTNENELKFSIPNRETKIIVNFLGLYLKNLKSQQAGNTTDFDKRPAAVNGPSSLSSTPLDSSSYASAVNTSSPLSLIGLILKTLPLRQGVSVSYESNRRQLHRTSPWTLVTLQPTDLSRMLQEGVLSTLENSMREKAILSINDVIDNNPNAKIFVPIVTELVAPGYNMCVPVPMSLGRILSRLKTNYYTSMESILGDLHLISENCLLYNSPESDLVAHCNDIVGLCQINIKAIIQNLYVKIERNDFGGTTKRNATAIPSDLNTPYKGNLHMDWLKQIAPDGTCVEVGRRTRNVATSSWIPQVGDPILYSRSNHSAFVYGHRDSLANAQCNVPQFQKIETEEKKNLTAEETTNGECATLHENKRSSEENKEDDFFEKTSFHWMNGTVVSVRSSFPRNMTNIIKESFTVVTPILIVELRLQYSQCDRTLFVCWRPCLFSKLDTSKCKACNNTKDSFLKPAWISSTDELQILPPDSSQGHEFTSGLPKDTIISIERCFDFLKHRCINGINQDAFAVNPDSALENAERGVTINLRSQSIPSYIDFFSPLDAKHVSRGMKKAECTDTKKLSSVGYMPLWSLEAQHPTQTAKHKTLRHDSRMSFPSLCLELIRLRITSGYYRNTSSVVNDISESYISSVLYLLSEPSTRKNDRISIRKIARVCLSGKGNGKINKIPIKKISKKKKTEEAAARAPASTDKKQSKKGSKVSVFDGLNDEEKALTRQIFQIRMYHAAAIVFALNANQMEKLFCLKSMVESPTQAPEPISDNSALDNANFTPEQLVGIQDIRNLLNAIGKDQCRNRFKFSYRNTYKLKVKCEGQFITKNGSLLETNEGGSFLFEPASTVALLPNGSHVNIQIRCGNEYVHAEKRRIAVELESLTNEPNHTGISDASQPIDTARSISTYSSSMIGQDRFIFSWPELKNNEELVRTLFCSKGRMNACVMCQVTGISLLECRVQRYHSNPDYAFNERFKGTNGCDSLLLPWRQTQDKNHESAVNAPADANTTATMSATASNQLSVTDTTSERQRVEKEVAVAFAKQASETKESFIKADKAFKLAGYLYNQADLLKQTKLKLSEDFIKANFPSDPEDNHYVFCIHCGCAGDLLICDGCPNVSHPKCVGLAEVPEGDWFCKKCENAKPKCNATCKSDKAVQKDEKKQEDNNQKEETCVVGNSHSDSIKSAPGEVVSSEITTEFSSLSNCTDSDVKDDEIKHRNESNEMSMETNLSTNIPLSTSIDEGVDSNKGATANESKNEAKPQAMPTVVSSDNPEAQVPQSFTETDQPAQTIAPEIDDCEFDEKESELEKLLSELINQRAPPEAKSNEKQMSRAGKAENGTTKSSLSDPIDALGDTTTWIRQFLSFILIKSGCELLSTKSDAIGKDMEMWRKEKGMKPLSSTGYLSTVSGWKATVRKAGTMVDCKGETGDDNLSDDDEVMPQEKSRSGKRKRSVDSLQSLPKQGRRFCASIGIKDAEEFLATKSLTLSKKYATWRKREGMPALQSSGTSAYIGAWKTKVRKDFETSSQEDVKLAIPLGCQVPIGFKVRKLFEDGNYYNGEVSSGPSTAFDKDRQIEVSCWRVKYVDGDEEEFSLEELNMWAVASITVTTGSNEDENEDDDDSMSSNNYESK